MDQQDPRAKRLHGLKRLLEKNPSDKGTHEYREVEREIKELENTIPTRIISDDVSRAYDHRDKRIDNLLDSKGTIKNGYGVWIDGQLIVPNPNHPLPDEIKARIKLREPSIEETIERLKTWDTRDSKEVIKHAELFKKPHQCSACEESFNTVREMRIHGKKYHS